jgi:uncharacterized integral membrane protein
MMNEEKVENDINSIPSKNKNESEKSKVGTVWITLTVFVVILLLLIIFILQNSITVHIKYFGAKGTLQFGVAMLIAAVAGSLLTLLVGSARIIQLKTRRKSKI